MRLHAAAMGWGGGGEVLLVQRRFVHKLSAASVGAWSKVAPDVLEPLSIGCFQSCCLAETPRAVSGDLTVSLLGGP